MKNCLGETPIPPDGPVDGPRNGPEQPEGPSKPGQQNDVPPPAQAANPEPSAASLAEILPPTWCPHCKAFEEKPHGKGQCRRCGRVLKGAFLARRHPVNLLRRDALLAKLIADYQPNTTVLRSSCEVLAGILEQLESLKPGSQEHQRLVTLSQLLGKSLDESLAARTANAPQEDLETASTDELIGKTTAILRHLLEIRDATPAHDQRDAGLTVQAATPTTSEGVAPTSALAPQPEPVCPYCRRPQAACDKLRAEKPDIWGVICSSHPDVVKTRDARATAEMWQQLGQGLPRWYTE